MNEDHHIAIGLMTGTSVDAIDAVAVEVTLTRRPEIRLLEGITYSIPECVRRQIFQLFGDGAGALVGARILSAQAWECARRDGRVPGGGVGQDIAPLGRCMCGPGRLNQKRRRGRRLSNRVRPASLAHSRACSCSDRDMRRLSLGSEAAM